jgi:hypothetical protein
MKFLSPLIFFFKSTVGLIQWLKHALERKQERETQERIQIRGECSSFL